MRMRDNLPVADYFHLNHRTPIHSTYQSYIIIFYIYTVWDIPYTIYWYIPESRLTDRMKYVFSSIYLFIFPILCILLIMSAADSVFLGTLESSSMLLLILLMNDKVVAIVSITFTRYHPLPSQGRFSVFRSGWAQFMG